MNACSLCEPTHNRSVRETGRCDCVCHRPVERRSRDYWFGAVAAWLVAP